MTGKITGIASRPIKKGFIRIYKSDPKNVRNEGGISEVFEVIYDVGGTIHIIDTEDNQEKKTKFDNYV